MQEEQEKHNSQAIVGICGADVFYEKKLVRYFKTQANEMLSAMWIQEKEAFQGNSNKLELLLPSNLKLCTLG